MNRFWRNFWPKDKVIRFWWRSRIQITAEVVYYENDGRHIECELYVTVLSEGLGLLRKGVSRKLARLAIYSCFITAETRTEGIVVIRWNKELNFQQSCCKQWRSTVSCWMVLHSHNRKLIFAITVTADPSVWPSIWLVLLSTEIHLSR